MSIDYIIVQAGGRGGRLGYLTDNKPKALVPVENLPMLFHIFRKYDDKKFVIITDYKKDILREYLECFARVKYQVVDATGEGTCAGVRKALDLLPEDRSFILIWSDLILPEKFILPKEPGNYIGISQTFPCRWSYQNGSFCEQTSLEHGVAGLFIFESKECLADVPEAGELVRWMQSNAMRFCELGLAGTREYGLLCEYESLEQEKCRPFNKITMDGDILIKEPVDDQGQKLAELEQMWYQAATEKGVRNIPKIHANNPLKMERIIGKNIYECSSLSYSEKRAALQKIITALHGLHGLDQVPSDTFSIKEAYYTKTVGRLNKIRDLVPFASQKTITVNDRKCRNIYYYKRDLEIKLDALHCKSFAFIHGDCTFSNLMLRDDAEPVFIDPRGYFGHTTLYGDPNYDWAKLYYSIVGNYDRFNLKDFSLTIEENNVKIDIASNGWEGLEDDFFSMSGADPYTIKLLHAVIWLSLTTYVWQDYDSICGAFYNGLYYLEEVL